ncbi:MAG TPA: hypothetical protein VJ838_09790 [Gaiellaceae bacterium]|nr:hypothetical protein [Gaiellaceae bacterium]
MRRRRLRWDESAPPSKHPYRDSAIFYAFLAIMIVVVTAVTNGNLLPGDVDGKAGILRWIGRVGAVPVAAIFFVVATAFSWWRLRDRMATEADQ